MNRAFKSKIKIVLVLALALSISQFIQVSLAAEPTFVDLQIVGNHFRFPSQELQQWNTDNKTNDLVAIIGFQLPTYKFLNSSSENYFQSEYGSYLRVSILNNNSPLHPFDPKDKLSMAWGLTKNPGVEKEYQKIGLKNDLLYAGSKNGQDFFTTKNKKYFMTCNRPNPNLLNMCHAYFNSYKNIQIAIYMSRNKFFMFPNILTKINNILQSHEVKSS